MGASIDAVYYIGQGQAFYAPRQAGGPIIGGYQYFGDTQSLQVNSKQKTVEVEENVTGFGGVALHAAVSIPLDFKVTLPIWSIKNLVLALYGTTTGANAGGTVAGEVSTSYLDGGMTRLANFGLTGVPTLSWAAGQVTGYTVTAGGAGYTTAPTVSFTAPPAGGRSPVATATIAAGAVTGLVFTDLGLGYTTAPTVTLTGGGFTTAATITTTVTAKALTPGTDYTYNAQFGQYSLIPTSASFTGFTLSPSASLQITAGYSYGANNGFVNMLTAPSQEVSLQFNGLNVASPSSSGFNGVPVLIKRARLDFTKMIDLISKKEGVLDLAGAIMFDSTATDGIPYGTFAKA